MIAVLGEALIDFIGMRSADGSDCYQPHPGGCALNASVAAARMGAPVTYVGRLSSDMFGESMQSHLRTNNVALLPELCGCPEHSMIGFARLDERGSATYAFYIEGTTITKMDCASIMQSLQSIPGLRFLHVGSVALTLTSSGMAISDALERLTPKPFVFLDPNVRLTMVEDLQSYRERLFRVVSAASIVKLSDEDLAVLYPHLDAEQAVERLLEGGAAHVVLTRGSKGLQWCTATGLRVEQPAFPVDVVDTVGAGDTVSGTLLAYLDEHRLYDAAAITERHVRTASRLAAAAAAITCSRKGCDPPFKGEPALKSS